MDRALWRKHLAQAQAHVARSRRNVALQKGIVAALRRDGHPAELAERVLDSYEQTLALHIDDVARLKKDLAKAGVAGNG